MASLREMQEAIDENKENIPEGTYVQLMAGLANAYRHQEPTPSNRAYYVVSWVSVAATSSYRVNAMQHSSICEIVSRGPTASHDGWAEALRTSHITTAMVRATVFPLVIRDGRGGVSIVCSAERYGEDDDYDMTESEL